VNNGGSDNREQQHLGEYVLIVVVTVLVAVGTLTLFATQISDILAWIAEEIHSQ
jgi:hypothetical protein